MSNNNLDNVLKYRPLGGGASTSGSGSQGTPGKQGPAGPQGPQGLPGQAIVNLDGGTPSSVYGGITSLDFGGV